MKNLKRSTLNLMKTILFLICSLTWLPEMTEDGVTPLRIVMPILCIALSVLFLVQYFKCRKAE